MALPIFEDFLYPFLLQLKNKDVTTKEMKEAIIKHFNLTDKDCLVKTQSGSANQLNDRLGWCRQYLRRALMIELPVRGVYRITQRGKDYLAKHDSLRKQDLMQYEEFAEYANGFSTSKGKSKDGNNGNVVDLDMDEMTPTEQMDTAFKTIYDDLAADLIRKLMEMSSSFFEKTVLDLLLKMGYGKGNTNMAMVTTISHDDGVDGIIPDDALGLNIIYFQAKRYKKDNSVGKPAIQQFIGALEEKKANKGVFITTSRFTSGAIETTNKSVKKIVLINGQELADYMIKYNVGVSERKVYEVKKLNTDYFEE